MKSKNSTIKKKTQKPNTSVIVPEKSQKYISKNISKKYIYKKEKAADTDKILQNNKLSKNYIFSPIHTKHRDRLIKKNSINSDLRRPPEMREDVNIDYEKYHQQTLHTKHPSLGSLNFMNNIPTSPTLKKNELNQSYYILERKNGFMANNNRSVDNLISNKWKCPQCGNVNSNFNYLCNNCNMPNTSLLNDTLNINQKNNSTGKNIKALNIDNNSIINNSFNSNLSGNIFSKSINNTVMKKQILKKNNTKSDLTIKNNNNIVSSPYYSNVGFNTIRPNKNNTNYFYNEPINNSINNSSNFYETERDSNITHLYSYSNYLANELKTSNDANIKLLENYQNNENEYKNIYEQNDLIKKKIKVLREKENQLDKINEQLQKSLQFIHNKFKNKSNINDNNNYILNSLIENREKNLEDINSKIDKYNEENEKLNEKLKENKKLINDMKKRIEELSEKNNNDVNINLKQKIQLIIDIKNNIEKYYKEIKA